VGSTGEVLGAGANNALHTCKHGVLCAVVYTDCNHLRAWKALVQAAFQQYREICRAMSRQKLRRSLA